VISLLMIVLSNVSPVVSRCSRRTSQTRNCENQSAKRSELLSTLIAEWKDTLLIKYV